MLISLRIPDDLLAEIDAEALADDRSRNAILIRRLMRESKPHQPSKLRVTGHAACDPDHKEVEPKAFKWSIWDDIDSIRKEK